MGNILSVSDLSYRYPGNDTDTLKGFSFTVDQGEIFGFLGPSGAGKSTTQKILIKLISVFSGKYEVFGKEISLWKRSLFERIGVAFEVPNLYEKFTARENLHYFGGFYGGKLKDVDLILERLGLESDVDRRVSTYSKGMRTRLNLARAILHNPDLLFLDEPTSGLDPAYTRMVMELILDLKKQGRTIFLTTHNMTVADGLCDRLAFMVNGDISRVDSPENLKKEYGTRKLEVEYRQQGVKMADVFPLDGLGLNRSFLDLLKSLEQGELQRVHSQEASLGDVFLDITGTKLK